MELVVFDLNKNEWSFRNTWKPSTYVLCECVRCNLFWFFFFFLTKNLSILPSKGTKRTLVTWTMNRNDLPILCILAYTLPATPLVVLLYIHRFLPNIVPIEEWLSKLFLGYFVLILLVLVWIGSRWKLMKEGGQKDSEVFDKNVSSRYRFSGKYWFSLSSLDQRLSPYHFCLDQCPQRVCVQSVGLPTMKRLLAHHRHRSFSHSTFSFWLCFTFPNSWPLLSSNHQAYWV